MQDRQFRKPLALAIAAGATTPDPGQAGVTVYSSTLGREVIWTGTQWVALSTSLDIVAPSGSSISSGGAVVSTGAYNFTASSINYIIQGIAYAAAQTNFTLSAADATYDRIDVLVVNTSGVYAVLAGTPAAIPVTPSVDASTQLLVTSFTVSAASTSPSVLSDNIYLENVEWTTSTSASHVNAASTSNPFAGTKDVEFTSAGNTDYVQFQKSTTLNIGTFNYLVLNIRSKATWPSQKSLVISWLLSGAPLGTTIALKDGVYGFNSASTSAYQQVVIPLSTFGLNGVSVNQLRLTVSGSASSIGLYVDNVFLQGGVTQTTNTNSLTWQGAWSATFGYNANDVVTTGSASAGTLILFRAKAANTNVATTVTATWEQISATRVDSSYATLPGNLSVFAGTIRWYPNRPITLSSVRVDMGTGPASGSAVFNVRKNGTALFSGTKPTVTAGNHSSTPVAATATLNGTTDYLTVDCETASGADAVVRIDFS